MSSKVGHLFFLLFIVLHLLTSLIPHQSVEARRPPRDYGQLLPAGGTKKPKKGGRQGRFEEEDEDNSDKLTGNAFQWASEGRNAGNDNDDHLNNESDGRFQLNDRAPVQNRWWRSEKLRNRQQWRRK